MKEIKELIEFHLEEPYDTLFAYEKCIHYDYKEYKDGKLFGIVSYFPLPSLMYDMIITMNRDNIFSFKQWKIIFTILKERKKEIRIDSDPTNPKLIKGAKNYNGYFEGNTLIFPYTEED